MSRPYWRKHATPTTDHSIPMKSRFRATNSPKIFKMIGASVPDLRWTIEDIQTHGNQILVRGKTTGIPTGDFWGAKPTGKSFNTMAIDIFTVKKGKLSTCYHVENWVGALQQIGK